jgi:hypothetical protein
MLSLVALVMITSCAPVARPVLSGNEPDAEPTQDERGIVVHSTADPEILAEIEAMRNPEVPDLPFPDNPDPSLCGIPIQWGSDGKAWLKGTFNGELIQETVLLYDSHLRLAIKAQAPHGTEVSILLYQENPVTDYYMVKIKGAEPPNEGWIPEHFLSFEPIELIN